MKSRIKIELADNYVDVSSKPIKVGLMTEHFQKSADGRAA